ncbi:unnamed protein product [Prorocentrum cordatum]|uniref:Uncharacterized protein n=1 Tax=Prorocentrum cordatum TaxID=2364126 RepID=A0ABN9UV22_9DINO|nr:unnamed protein product [Polarella glacialis]
MHMHRSWQGPSLTQDRCICLPGQGRRAYAPMPGSGWAWPESVYVHSSVSSRLEYMLQTTMPEGRTPEVVCSRLERNSTDSSYVVRSCPGSAASGCSADCGSCVQDMVRHFTLDRCAAGWKLHQGAAPEDCAGERKECAGLNQVDVGLSRWCNRWPVAGETSSAKSSDELSGSAAA